VILNRELVPAVSQLGRVPVLDGDVRVRGPKEGSRLLVADVSRPLP